MTNVLAPFEEPDEPDDLDDANFPAVDDDDDSRWDVFLPDDDPYEPLPEPGDFWMDWESE